MWLNVCVSRPSSSDDLRGHVDVEAARRRPRAPRASAGASARPAAASAAAWRGSRTTTSSATTPIAPTICSRNCLRCGSSVMPRRMRPTGAASRAPALRSLVGRSPRAHARDGPRAAHRRDQLDVALAVQVELARADRAGRDARRCDRDRRQAAHSRAPARSGAPTARCPAGRARSRTPPPDRRRRCRASGRGAGGRTCRARTRRARP